MTDPTHEAPERIWTWKDDVFDVLVSNEHGDPRYTPKSAREYVRADLVQAAVAAERERCAQVAHDAWMDGVPIAEIPAAIRAGGE